MMLLENTQYNYDMITVSSPHMLFHTVNDKYFYARDDFPAWAMRPNLEKVKPIFLVNKRNLSQQLSFKRNTVNPGSRSRITL